jgi:hypothetical protein
MWRWRNNQKELLSTWNGSCLYIRHNYEPLIGYYQIALDKTNFQAELGANAAVDGTCNHRQYGVARSFMVGFLRHNS